MGMVRLIFMRSSKLIWRIQENDISSQLFEDSVKLLTNEVKSLNKPGREVILEVVDQGKIIKEVVIQ